MYISIKYEIYKRQQIQSYATDEIIEVANLDIDDIIKALAHPVRRQILAWLKEPEKSFRHRRIRLNWAYAPARFLKRRISRNRPFLSIWRHCKKRGWSPRKKSGSGFFIPAMKP